MKSSVCSTVSEFRAKSPPAVLETDLLPPPPTANEKQGTSGDSVDGGKPEDLLSNEFVKVKQSQGESKRSLRRQVSQMSLHSPEGRTMDAAWKLRERARRL